MNSFLSRFLLLTACFPGTGTVLFADVAETFFTQNAGLAEYIKQAYAANPGLQALEQKVEAARQRVPQAEALPDPSLRLTRFVESVQTRTGPQENVVQLTQSFPWFGTLAERESAASAEARMLWFAWQAQYLALARQVSSAFHDYAYTGEAIRLTRENRDLLRELEPVVEEKVKGGGALNPLLRLKVEIGKVDDRLQSLKRKRVVQSAGLVELLALSTEQVLPFPEWSVPEAVKLNGESLTQAMMETHPELKMLDQAIDRAEARVELAKLRAYPNLSVGVNYIQVGDPAVGGTADAGEDSWSLMLGMSLPLWGDKNSGARVEALAMKGETEKEREKRVNELRAELTASLALLEDANRRLKLYGEELLGLAGQAVENSRTSYQGGGTGILEVIDSERSLLDLQLLHWRAAADAWQRRVIIQTLANQPLSQIFETKEHHE